MHWKKTAAWLGCLAAVAGLAAAVALIDVNRFKPVIADAVRKTTGREIAISGDLSLVFGLRPTLAAEDVRIANAEWGSRPGLATIRRLEIQVSLIPLLVQKIEIVRLVMIEPDILLETDPSGAANLNFSPGGQEPRLPTGAPSEKRPASPPALTVHNLDIRNGRIAYRDGRTGASHAVSVETFTAAKAAGENRLTVSLKGVWNSLPFEFTGILLDTAPGLFHLDDIRFSARAAGAALTATGRISDLMARKASLNVHLSAPSLPRLMALGGMHGLPDVGPVTIDAELEIPDAETFQATTLNAVFGESDLRGSATLALSGKRPKLSAELSSRRLDLRLPAERSSAPSAKPTSGGGRIFPKKPLPLDKLNHIDADLRLRLAQVLTERASVTEIETDIRLESGRLRMTPIRAASGGSTLAASLEINAAEKIPAIAMTLRGNQLNLGKIFSQPGAGKTLSGRADVDANLTGRGRSVAEVMGNLNGRMVFAVQNGRVARRFIDRFPLYVTRGLIEQIFFLLGTPAGGMADIRCLFANLDIRNGMVDVSPLVINTPTMTVFSAGDIDLKTEQIDLSVSTEPTRETNMIQLGMGQLTKIFKLTGTLARPSLSVDPVETAILLAKVFGGMTIAGTLVAAEALLGSRDAKENPCLQITASPQKEYPASKALRKTGEVMKRAVEDAQKSILNLFKNP